MASKFQVIALRSLDIDGDDVRGEPVLFYPDALKMAQDLKSQGKAFRVIPNPVCSEEERIAFRDLGALD